jgi:hypothetical protein
MCDTNTRGVCTHHVLFYLVATGDTQNIKALLKAKMVDLNMEYKIYHNPLIIAAGCGRKAVLEPSIACGANVDYEKGENGAALHATFEHVAALHVAAFQGRNDLVRLLLEHGADIQKDSAVGYPLEAASGTEGNTDIIKLLVDEGAQVDAISNECGTSALVRAALNDHTDIVELLLDRKADLNLRTPKSGTALEAASAQGHHEVVKLLLDHCAKMDIKPKFCGKILKSASSRGHHKVVKLLLKYCAKMKIKITSYDDVLRAASSEGHNFMAILLLNHCNEKNVEITSWVKYSKQL